MVAARRVCGQGGVVLGDINCLEATLPLDPIDDGHVSACDGLGRVLYFLQPPSFPEYSNVQTGPWCIIKSVCSLSTLHLEKQHAESSQTAEEV